MAITCLGTSMTRNRLLYNQCRLCTSGGVSKPPNPFFSHFLCNCCYSHLFPDIIIVDVVKPRDAHGSTQHFHPHYLDSVQLNSNCKVLKRF